MMRAQLLAALRALAVFTVVCGVLYPLVVLGVARAGWPGRAQGSLVEVDGRVVGSRLLGQPFDGPRYFHGRPSAATAEAGAASNLGPTNPVLLREVRRRVERYRAENGLAAGTPVPADAVTTSGSGLDPDISVADARLQAGRVARARHLPRTVVLRLVDRATAPRYWGFLGEPGVNVLSLNVSLDALR